MSLKIRLASMLKNKGKAGKTAEEIAEKCHDSTPGYYSSPESMYYGSSWKYCNYMAGGIWFI